MKRHGDSPTLTVPQMALLLRLAVPEGTDARLVPRARTARAEITGFLRERFAVSR